MGFIMFCFWLGTMIMCEITQVCSLEFKLMFTVASLLVMTINSATNKICKNKSGE